MAYIKAIGLGPGETVTETIDTYLNYNMQGLTAQDTVIEVNGNNFPIGYFDEDTIDLFKLGFETIKNIDRIDQLTGKHFSEEHKKHAQYFIDESFDKYDKQPLYTEKMLLAFNDLSTKINTELFDEEQLQQINERQEQLYNQNNQTSNNKQL